MDKKQILHFVQYDHYAQYDKRHLFKYKRRVSIIYDAWYCFGIPRMRLTKP